MSTQGNMKHYPTGATRSAEGNKLDVKGFISPHAIEAYCAYMHRHRKQADGSIRGSDNWKNGIPEADYKRSLIRHAHDAHRAFEGATVLDKDSQEPVTEQELVCAIIFNCMGLLHEWNKPPVKTQGGWVENGITSGGQVRKFTDNGEQ